MLAVLLPPFGYPGGCSKRRGGRGCGGLRPAAPISSTGAVVLPLSCWMGGILQAFRRPGLLPPALISCTRAGVLLPGGVQHASRRQGLLSPAPASSTAVLALFFFLQS